MGSYTINPTAFRGSSTWTVTGAGGNAITAVSDSDDATYVNSAAQQHFIVKLYSATRLPFGARVKYIQAHMRASKNNAAPRRQKMSLGAAVGSNPNQDKSFRIGTFTLAFTLQNFNGYQERTWHDGTEITQEKIDSLLWGATWLGQQTDVRIQKVWGTVVYDEQPVVSGVSPSGTVSNTTSPTVSWTYTDDLEPQEAFEVEILDGSGNVVHQSGTISSANTFYDLPVGLAPGSYTVRVRAAQKWDGWRVSGKFWSDYKEATFTMAVQLPAPPSLVGIPQGSSGRVKIDYVSNLNLVPFDAAHFENEALSSFATTSNLTLAPTGAPVHSGGKSIRVNLGSSTPRELLPMDFLNISAAEGLTYRASAWVRPHVSATLTQVSIRINFFDEDYTQLATSTGTATTEIAGTWVEPNHSATAPADTRYVEAVILFGTGSTNGHFHYVDDVEIRVTDPDIPAPTMSGGASRGGLVYQTRNSIPYADSTFDTVANVGPSNANTTLAASTAQRFHVGDSASSLSLTRTGSTGTAGFVYGGNANQYRAVIAGDKVVATAFVYSAANVRSANVGLTFYDNDFVELDAANTATNTVVGSWLRLRHTATAPAGTAWMRFDGGVDNVPVAELHYIDLLSLSVNNESWSPSTNIIEPPLRSTSGPFMVIQYSEDEGTTWKDLRTLEPSGLDGKQSFFDYEAGHQMPRRYRAYTWFIEDTVMYASDYSAETDDIVLTLSQLWLHHLDSPEGTAYQFFLDGGGRSEDFDVSESALKVVGRNYPIAEFGETFERSYQAEVTLADGTSREAWRTLAEAQEMSVFRDQRGRRARGVIKNARLKDEKYDGQTATFTFELRGTQP